jgi:hypothetical protein
VPRDTVSGKRVEDPPGVDPPEPLSVVIVDDQLTGVRMPRRKPHNTQRPAGIRLTGRNSLRIPGAGDRRNRTRGESVKPLEKIHVRTAVVKEIKGRTG